MAARAARDKAPSVAAASLPRALPRPPAGRRPTGADRATWATTAHIQNSDMQHVCVGALRIRRECAWWHTDETGTRELSACALRR